MKTTAQPARALSSRAVGLGAWLVPPMGSGRSEFHENGPDSIAAWLPSECASTVGLLRAFSGCSSKRRTVWRIVSGCIFVLLPLAGYPFHDASRLGSPHLKKVCELPLYGVLRSSSPSNELATFMQLQISEILGMCSIA